MKRIERYVLGTDPLAIKANKKQARIIAYYFRELARLKDRRQRLKES